MKHKAKYSIGLGNSFLLRARITFIAIFVVLFSSIGIIGYLSYTSGEFEKQIGQPISALFEILAIRENEDSNISNVNWTPPTIAPYSTKSPTPTPTPTVNIKTNYQAPRIIYVTPTPIQKVDSNQWFEEQKAANDKWFEEQKAANQKRFEESSAQSKIDAQNKYDQAVQKQLEDLEKWKSENGF